MSDEQKKPKDVYNTPESHTRDPETGKRTVGRRVSVNKNSGEIISHGRRDPPPEWIPEGWIKIAANRWVPQWPSCMYRRLNVRVRPGKGPEIQPLCIKYDKFGEEIDHQTCMDCTVFQVPAHKMVDQELPSDVSLDDLFKRKWRAEGLDRDQEGAQELYLHPLDAYEEDELDALEERSFQMEMRNAPLPLNDAKHERNKRRVQQKWKIPCVHRILVPKSEEQVSRCGGCSTHVAVCNNPEADAFGQKLRRKICKECPFAEAPLDSKYGEPPEEPRDD